MHRSIHSPLARRRNFYVTAARKLLLGGNVAWSTTTLPRSRVSLSQVSSFTLFAAGDVIAQQLVEKNGIKGHDWVRTA